MNSASEPSNSYTGDAQLVSSDRRWSLVEKEMLFVLKRG